MNTKKMVIALFASFIVMFLLAGLWHMVIMADLYSGPNSLVEPMLYFIALGYFVLALIMTYIYPKGYKGGKPVIEGLKFGILMGLLWILPLSLVLYGVMGGSGTVIIVDVIWHVVEQGIGGIVIGLVYGSQSSTG
jgi:hypothetical protein